MNNDKQEIVVTDIQIPFVSMVVLMVKMVIASIPALIILTLLGAFFAGFLSSINGWCNCYNRISWMAGRSRQSYYILEFLKKSTNLIIAWLAWSLGEKLPGLFFCLNFTKLPAENFLLKPKKNLKTPWETQYFVTPSTLANQCSRKMDVGGLSRWYFYRCKEFQQN